MEIAVYQALAVFVVSALPVCLAWFSRRNLPNQPGLRTYLFTAGVAVGIVSAVLISCSFLDPFPLIADGHGGYSDIRNYRLVQFAIYPALAVIVLGLAGRGRPRLLLVAGGVVQFVCWYGALLACD